MTFQFLHRIPLRVNRDQVLAIIDFQFLHRIPLQRRGCTGNIEGLDDLSIPSPDSTRVHSRGHIRAAQLSIPSPDSTKPFNPPRNGLRQHLSIPSPDSTY